MARQTGTMVILTDEVSQQSGRNQQFLRDMLSLTAQQGFQVDNIVDLSSTQGQIIVTLSADDCGEEKSIYREFDIRGQGLG